MRIKHPDLDISALNSPEFLLITTIPSFEQMLSPQSHSYKIPNKIEMSILAQVEEGADESKKSFTLITTVKGKVQYRTISQW